MIGGDPNEPGSADLQVRIYLPRLLKQWIASVADGVMLVAALWSALALRYGYVDFAPERFWVLFLLTPLITVPVFAWLGLYRAILRYIGARAWVTIVRGVSVSAIAMALLAWAIPVIGFPRSAPAIYWLIALLYIAGSRLLVRSMFQWVGRRYVARQPALIYGAGESGRSLANLMRDSSQFLPVAYIDRNPQLQRGDINGVPVFSPDELVWVVSRYRVEVVLLALPSATHAERKQILDHLYPLGKRVLSVPALGDIVAGRISMNEVSEVAPEDLLGRDAVPPEPQLLHATVRERNVLVTGAGGSIGSELCRQIARLGPARLVLFDVSEYALYRIEQELIAELGAIELVAHVGSVRDGALVERVLQQHQIDTLYHAAAYKHVPLVERNVIEGVRNNVFGTLATARAAIRCGVTDFVMVSTDKAVAPVNVMGATKRVAELVLAALEQQTDQPRFAIVRFGNVLDSSGSVVPLFRQQIDAGGPVTVTHEQVERYFMTIPEAAELVLQAGGMPRAAGSVYVLDMGEPVRILDLATKMIQLAGRHPWLPGAGTAIGPGDIEVRFVGLRPGEKLREELYATMQVSGTLHPKILCASEPTLEWGELEPALAALAAACDRHDVAETRSLLERLTGSRLGGVAPPVPAPVKLDPADPATVD